MQIFLRCILSKFYIKPQLRMLLGSDVAGCILSKFYIKPQLIQSFVDAGERCILSKFYIKPQLVPPPGWRSPVVSYRNSTSNHN